LNSPPTGDIRRSFYSITSSAATTSRQDVVPITRDYIVREEARLRAVEGDQRPPLRLAGE
jgi:hypothetical protein